MQWNKRIHFHVDEFWSYVITYWQQVEIRKNVIKKMCKNMIQQEPCSPSFGDTSHDQNLMIKFVAFKTETA